MRKSYRSYGYLIQVDVDISGSHLFCGLKTDHTLSSPSMSSVPNNRFTFVAIGNYFGCGTKENGTLVCWDNNYGKPSGNKPGKPTLTEGATTPPENTTLKSDPIPPLVTSSCTQAELDNAHNAGMSACKNNPAACGIVTESSACPIDNTCPVCPATEPSTAPACPIAEPSTEIEQIREEGKEEGKAICRTNPASCGIVNIPDLDANSGTDLSFLSFVPNKPTDSHSVFYNVGEKIEIDLVENFQQANRFESVDLWVIIELPNRDLVYKTPKALGNISPNPQAFRLALNSTQTTHRVLEFEVLPGLGGDYTFSAIYVEEGKNPMTDGFFVQRSNVARLNVVLSNR